MEKKYAGFWWRFIAILIDGIIVWVIKMILITPMLGVIGFSAYKAASGDMSDAQTLGMVGTMFGSILLTWLLSAVAGWLYFSIMESSKLQGTVGKMALGIIVTDMDGNRISFARATGRYFSKIISGFILMIGYMMAGFTEKKQALHDIIASTLVWKK